MNAITKLRRPAPICTDPQFSDFFAGWAAERIPHVGPAGFGPCWGVGVIRDHDLAAAIVFHDWQPEAGTVQLSCAAETPRWASREVIRDVLWLAFGGSLGGACRKVWTAMPHTNERAIRFNEGIGMKREATLRHHFAEGVHAVICSMMAREYARRYGGA